MSHDYETLCRLDVAQVLHYFLFCTSFAEAVSTPALQILLHPYILWAMDRQSQEYIFRRDDQLIPIPLSFHPSRQYFDDEHDAQDQGEVTVMTVKFGDDSG